MPARRTAVCSSEAGVRGVDGRRRIERRSAAVRGVEARLNGVSKLQARRTAVCSPEAGVRGVDARSDHSAAARCRRGERRSAARERRSPAATRAGEPNGGLASGAVSARRSARTEVRPLPAPPRGGRRGPFRQPAHRRRDGLRKPWEADVARGLADEDREHHVALEDAASRRSAAALRALFALLSMQTEVADPPGLSGAASARRSARTSYARSALWRPRMTPRSPSSRTCFRLSRTQARPPASRPPASPRSRLRAAAALEGAPLRRTGAGRPRRQRACRDARRPSSCPADSGALSSARAFRLTCAAVAQLRCSPPSRRRCRPLPSTASPQPFRLPSMPLCNLSDSGGCLSAIFPDPKWKSRPGTAWARS